MELSKFPDESLVFHEISTLFGEFSYKHNYWIFKKDHEHVCGSIGHKMEAYCKNTDRVKIEVEGILARHRDKQDDQRVEQVGRECHSREWKKNLCVENSRDDT